MEENESIIKNYEEYEDPELLMLISEKNDDAKDIIYEKYQYIIGIVLKKYKKAATILGIEYKDLYQDAMLAFASAIEEYNDTKETSLATFITICVNRRLNNIVRHAKSIKNKMIKDALSLDYYYKDFDISLAELISDNNINNPLINMTSKETAKTLEKAINARLTPTEKDVYELLIGGLNNNQIAKILKKTPKTTANTIQRIKKKVSDIVKNMDM